MRCQMTVLLVALHLLVAGATATTIQVPSQYPTIQAGLNAASPTDTVLVAAGLYPEHAIVMPAGVCLRGASGQADAVVIDAQQQGHAILCHSLAADTTRIERLTVTGGSNGIDVLDSATLSLKSCILRSHDGWGLACDDGAIVVLTGCTVAGNDSGGVRLGGGSVLTGARCTIAENGTGVFCDSAQVDLSAALIVFNDPGFAVTFNESVDDLGLSCCNFYGHAAGDWSGGLQSYLGIDGNFSAHPLFCDAGAGDYTLAANSPCLPGQHPSGVSCGIVGAWGQGCGAVAIVVCWDGGGHYEFIQKAIDAAVTGSVIEICDGVYTGPGNRDLDYKGKAVTVRSQSGDSSACVIDCGGSPGAPHRGVWFHSGEDTLSILQGVTIRNGYAADQGGGILCGATAPVASASPKIASCLVTGCTAPVGAGLAVVGDTSSPRIQHCLFQGNNGPGAEWDVANGGISNISHCRFDDNTGSGLAVFGEWLGGGDPTFSHCTFSGNASHGVHYGVDFGECTFYLCQMIDNGGWGATVFGSESLDAVIDSCQVYDNGAGGVRTLAIDTGLRLRRTAILANEGPGLLLNESAYMPDITDCIIRYNADDGISYLGVKNKEIQPEKARHLSLHGSDISFNGQVGLNIDGQLLPVIGVSGCTIIGNGSSGVSLAGSCVFGDCSIVLSGNTIVFNQADGIVFAAGMPCSLRTSILAFNAGRAMVSAPDDTVHLSCCDVYGNAQGDWTDNIAFFAGIEGNFSANPLFCDPEDTLFTLAANSPCLPKNHPYGFGCDVVGALAKGCTARTFAPDRVALSGAPCPHVHPGDSLTLYVAIRDAAGAAAPDEGIPPSLTCLGGLGSLGDLLLQPDFLWRATYGAGLVVGLDTCVAHDPEAATQPYDTLIVDVTERAIITEVADVPSDHGGQVRIFLQRDLNDQPGAPAPIAYYVAWRRYDGKPEIPGRDVIDLDLKDRQALVFTDDGTQLPLLRVYSAIWEPVGPQIPAMMWPEYASVVPTLADSSAAGIPYSVFFISAHTVNPEVYFVSAPDSGYSVDDLSPSSPEGFTAAYGADGNLLSWLESSEPDFQFFRVYRGGDPDFQIGLGNLVHLTTTTSWFDDTVAEPWVWHYKITAVVYSGDESPPAAPELVTGLEHAPVPGRFALRPCAPNPFNPRTVLSFDVPAGGGRVALRIYDVQGRLVRILVDGIQTVGRHDLVWDGCDALGRKVPSGVYFSRLDAQGLTETIKMTLVQ
jgi:hypothetical protein